MSKKIFFTPGPSELYFTVEGHIKTALKEQIPSLSHRSQHFKIIYKHTVDNIRQLLNLPPDYKIFFTASATEVWEQLIRNCVSSESHHLVNGAFSKKFWEFSGLMGKRNGMSESPDGSCMAPEDLNLSEHTELLGITLNESSTGVAFPLDHLQKIREQHPQVLIAIDGVSSLPIPELDFSLVDTAYFSVQKCFGLPAGLGVWVVGPRCIDKAIALDRRGELNVTHRSLLAMDKMGKDYQTIETPNILNIYLLDKVVEDMMMKGIDVIRRESRYKAAVVDQMIQNLDWLSHFVHEPTFRSETVIAAQCQRDTKDIIEKLNSRGFVIGSGYGPYKFKHLRISNFPTHSKELVEKFSDIVSSI